MMVVAVASILALGFRARPSGTRVCVRLSGGWWLASPEHALEVVCELAAPELWGRA